MNARAVVASICAVATIAALAGAAIVAAPTAFPTPTVSASTLTQRAPADVGVVLNWTKRGAVSGSATVYPTTYRVVVVAKGADPTGTIIYDVIHPTLRDTLVMTRTVCPGVDTLIVGVTALGNAAVSSSRTGTTRLALRCRTLTALQQMAEDTALLDSFPAIDRRITRADTTAGTARDAMLTGERYQQCWFGRNRFTGVVATLSGDQVKCEPQRLRMQAERAG